MTLPSISEYTTAIKNPKLVKAPMLCNGHPLLKKNKVVKYSGGFCVVFPYETSSNKYAVRCWHASVSDMEDRTRIIADALQKANLPYFVNFQYVSNGIATAQGLQPIVVMDWVKAKPLKKFLSEHLYDSNVIEQLASNFKEMVATLHKHHFSHGDLQHGNIMVKPDNLQLILVDYDSMFVPGLEHYSDEIKGLQGYQHKGRLRNKYASEKADYFSELVIYLSLKTLAEDNSWWTKLNMEDSETMLFNADDINSCGSSPIFQALSSYKDLVPLVNKLREFMHKSTIDELEPLEDITTSLADHIEGLWRRGNGYNKPEFNPTSIANNISKKW